MRPYRLPRPLSQAEPLASKASDGYLGLLYTMDDYAVFVGAIVAALTRRYGYVTNTRVRLVLILGLADLVVRDVDVKAVRARAFAVSCGLVLRARGRYLDGFVDTCLTHGPDLPRDPLGLRQLRLQPVHARLDDGCRIARLNDRQADPEQALRRADRRHRQRPHHGRCCVKIECVRCAERLARLPAHRTRRCACYVVLVATDVSMVLLWLCVRDGQASCRVYTHSCACRDRD